jgi:hypothetical protein
MANRSRVLTEAQLQAFITSLMKYCANTVFTLSGTTYTAAQLVASFTATLNASSAVTAARTALRAAVLAEAQVEATNGKLVRETKDVITLMFEGVPATLSAFLIPEPKPRKPLSAEARAAANAKAAATRKARGTISKKQKALIHGAVTGVTITPVTSSGASVSLIPSGAPAASASPASAPVTVGVVATGSTPAH